MPPRWPRALITVVVKPSNATVVVWPSGGQFASPIAYPECKPLIGMPRSTFFARRLRRTGSPGIGCRTSSSLTRCGCFPNTIERPSFAAARTLSDCGLCPALFDGEVFRPEGHVYELPDFLSGRITFLSVFDWQRRKGWDLLLRAYCETFQVEDRACLLLKVSRMHDQTESAVMEAAAGVLQTLNDRARFCDKSLLEQNDKK